MSSFTFHLTKHTGDLEMVVRHGVVPVKLVPPFVHVATEVYEADVQVCAAKPGELVYLGMLGGASCASYEIVGSLIAPGASCAEPSSDTQLTYAGVAAAADGEIRSGSTVERGSCQPRGWFDWHVEVTEQMVDAADNLVFEVEIEGANSRGALSNEAISLHLYAGTIPLERHTERVATVPDEAIYSIAIPATELVVGDYFLSVRCGAVARVFRGIMFEVRGNTQWSCRWR